MEKKKGRFKWDIILIAGILAVGAVLALVLLLTSKTGATVQVRVDGEIIKTFPLNVDIQYEITGSEGGKNLLIIENGTARVEEADCPDALCVNMGRISRGGQSIVCLPHKVVVEIVNEEKDSDDPDIIVG